MIPVLTYPLMQMRFVGFLDNDCDGLIDDDDDSVLGTTDWYADTDEDGFGDVNTTVQACVAPSGYVGDDTDCDDTTLLYLHKRTGLSTQMEILLEIQTTFL